MQQTEFQGGNPRLSPDGKQVVTWDGSTIRLHDLMGKKLAEFQGSDPRFSPDSKKLAEFQGGNPLFSPGSKQVVTGDGSPIGLYDLTGKKLAKFQGSDPRFSPDSKQVVTGDGNTSRLYDLTGKKLAEFQGSNPRFSPDGKQVITTFPDEDITRLYDLGGNLLAEYLGSTVSSNSRYRDLSLGFTKGGTQILTLTSDGTLRVWDIDAGVTIDGGLDDLLRRGCAELKNFRHREDVRKVCPEN